MNNVVDEVLASSPRYNIYDANGNLVYANAQIDLSTQVTTAGTPLNKALFDSIRDDINSRLLITNKATTTEAQAGTTDTKYTTPLKVRQQLQYLTKTGSASNYQTTNQNVTIYSASNVPSGVKRVLITGKLYQSAGGYPSYLNINGTGFYFDCTNKMPYANYTYPIIEDTQIYYPYGESRIRGSFKIEIDLSSKTFTTMVKFQGHNTAQYFDCGGGWFTTLTDVTIALRGGGNTNYTSTLDYTITYMY